MENKSEAVKRELLKGIIERYGNKEKKVVVNRVKEAGIYQNYVDDNEVYELVRKFAEYHNLPFGCRERPVIDSNPEVLTKVLVQDPCVDEEVDHFYEHLREEHSRLSKKILALNKLMELYKTNTHETKKAN
jgi:hypothetical protein